MKLHNFSAGPSILPNSVFEQASAAVLNFNNMGLSILEISHRSKEFYAVMDESVALVKELLSLPSGYEVLFLQGGASSQFSMVPYNLLPEGGKACFLDTGVWSSKAIIEAAKFGKTSIAASSKDKNYSYIPTQYEIDKDANYFHITTNNTIFGTELFDFPNSPIPVVADMSSDIFSRPMDFSAFDLVYAGAQKNLGPAGATLVIVNPSILGKTGRNLASMWDYTTFIKENSLYNTPAVFPIYVCLLTLRWLKAQGGVAEMEKRNIAKSNLLYAEIDRNPLFYGQVAKENRSRMNPVFRLHDESREKEFSKFVEDKGIVGINGHRLSGGFRASMYNALPIESVQVLVDAMKEFGKNNGE
ncbi:MAG: 3-phosphoserine/phosphohydroxythreonine transaminase [Bacteroidetes bacterium]|nr:3-phosphoserine/phosphohydroxythreonine transaminase [Bacteroidota bacterium]